MWFLAASPSTNKTHLPGKTRKHPTKQRNAGQEYESPGADHRLHSRYSQPHHPRYSQPSSSIKAPFINQLVEGAEIIQPAEDHAVSGRSSHGRFITKMAAEAMAEIAAATGKSPVQVMAA